MHVGAVTSTTFVVRPISLRYYPKGKIMKVKLNAFEYEELCWSFVGCCISTGCGTSSLGNLKEVSEVSGTSTSSNGTTFEGRKARAPSKGGGSQGASAMSADINKDGTFTIQSQGDERKQKI